MNDACPACSQPRAEGSSRCEGCGYDFVFDSERDGVTDLWFQSLIDQAAAHAERQLDADGLFSAYAERRARVRRRFGPRAKLGAVLLPLGLGLWIFALPRDRPLILMLGIVLALGGLALGFSGIELEHEAPEREPFERCLERWRGHGRDLTPRPSVEPADAPRA